MKKVWLSVGCVVLSCVAASAAMTQEDLSFVAGLDGTEQRYIKLTPPNLPAEKVDVVFWLHGHGSDRTQVNVYKGRGEIASSLDVCEQNGMLLIFPDYRATTSWMGPAAEADMLQLIGILTVALHFTYLLGDSVALALQTLYLADDTAATLLKSSKAVKTQRVVAVFQHFADSIKIFTDKFQI